MLKTKAIKKIFTTTLTMFIILTIYTIPTTSNKNILRTNLELADITSIPTNNIYLLNNNNYLVKTEIFLEGKTKEEKIKKIIDYLIINNNKLSNSLKGYLPENTKIQEINIKNDELYIDFSKEFLNYDKKIEKTIITGLTYSLLELKNINSLSFTVEKEYLKDIPTKLDKTIDINAEYSINSRNNINKVIVYYLYKNNYIPVTKYLNDNREKVEIIIDELKNNKNNLISPVNNNLELLDYYEEANVLFLNFNNYLLDDNKETTSRVLEEISYSVFDNYPDINMVIFKVNNEQKDYFKRYN